MRSAKKPKLCSRQIQDRAAELISPIFRPSSSRKCSAPVLLQVVLTAAANIISLFGACLRLGTISDQTARSELKSRLPKQRKPLEAKLNHALREPLPPNTRRRSRDLAIDYHEIPYHGHGPKNHVRGNKPRSGTTTFFTYATACLIHHGHRYTLAYTWVRAEDSTVEVLQRLLTEVGNSGVRIRKLLLDRGFFSVAVMQFLQERNCPFLMPVVMRGRKPRRGKKSTGWRMFRRKPAGWYRHTHRHKGEEVTVRVCVSYKSYRHHRTNKRRAKTLVFASWRVSGAPRDVRDAYRTRFGIESSYRQLGQARIRTSTRNPILRSFFVGLALLLRNLWVWFQALWFGEDRHPRVQAASKRFQFRWMLAVLAQGNNDNETLSDTRT
ncbi:transposase [Fimbriiglobus ruber]|uniref:transposase n=1 Tax=Fimbriiglobus ruber TaxID=1908690 RepID=UPI00137A7682|nr:transposase [Fimbriiglobus ruber]